MSRFEFDKRLGIMTPVNKSHEDEIHLMSQTPSRSCWIRLLQNRVNLKSVGNMRHAVDMYYDRTDQTLATERGGEDKTPFRTFVIEGVGRPAGWIYINK